MSATPDWAVYFRSLLETMISMLVILFVLSWSLEILKAIGLMKVMMTALAPVLRLAGIKGEASHLTAIGLFLGISYGAGLLIREADPSRYRRAKSFSPASLWDLRTA